MVTQEGRAKELKPRFDVDERLLIATHIRKLFNQVVRVLLLCNVLTNRPAKARNNKSKKVHSALS